MDEIELFGFIPNGGRIYYLSRSQPPLFVHVRVLRRTIRHHWFCSRLLKMLFNYVQGTGDVGILTRALPLAEVHHLVLTLQTFHTHHLSYQVELQWWFSNRTFNLTSPYTNVTHAISHYAVDVNSAPRPEVRHRVYIHVISLLIAVFFLVISWRLSNGSWCRNGWYCS